MTRPFVYRPPNPPARRAGVLLIVLGGVALLMGVIFVFAGLNLDAISKNDPAVAAKLDELRKQVQPIALRTVIVGWGVAVLAYAVAAITLGVLVRGGHKIVLIVTLVAALAMTALTGLFTMTALAQAPDGAIFPLLILAAHGVAVAWLIAALRQSSPAAVATRNVAYRPMQDYYLPPLPTPKA